MSSSKPTEDLPSSTEPDYRREALTRFWDPGKQLIRSIRKYQKAQKKGGVHKLVSKIAVLEYRFWSVCSGADIPLNCDLGGGIKLVHSQGIVIHRTAKIGVNLAIFQQVTIVADVVIGGQVEIGAGAKIVRPVKIGDRAKIGANAVVLCDVPEGKTAVGIPAKIV